jgi:catechol 2,3-dioxygenase-like lactoylglutathione lyase family enzyme
MRVTHLFAGIAAADYDASVAWYERLLGRPPDMLPREQEAVWRLSGTGWVYVVGDAVRAGGGMLTLLVDDLDAHLAGIAARGLVAGAVQPGGGGRKATIADPDGNTVTFAQVPGGDA